ncbi:MAG: hypothetical protein IT367_15670, partial [Candidatus Hydrogenedentes bacterium]|nr:hypothetical protein [Candidatus Hydrogenedentota bacterium]
MTGWLDWVRGKRPARANGKNTQTVATFSERETRGRQTSFSLPEDSTTWEWGAGRFIGMANDTPFFMLPVYRYLRDAFPDISDAVWTWKRLCQTGYDIEILRTSSDYAKARAERLLRELDTRVNSGDRGMDGLLDVFYTSLFTYGAAALEIVLSQS